MAFAQRSVNSVYDTRYAYSADGNRAAKWTATKASETLYFNMMWTWHTDTGLPEGQYSKHIYLGETRIVTKQTSKLDISYGQSDEYHHRYYYHPDHLGSAQLVTDYEGNEYQRIEYTPYGELWVEKKSKTEEGLRFLPYKFTAKEQDEETGLYYYGARYLDAKYSRWLSTDPAVGEYVSGTSAGEGGIYNTVNLSLYHYAGNNPVKYTDPNGEWAHIAVGAAIGAGVGAISAWASGTSGREIAAAAVGGAVTGGLAAATCGMSLGATIAGSAMAGTAGYLAENMIAGNQSTVEGATISGASGAAGAMTGAIVDKAVGMVSTAVSQTEKSVKTSSPYSNISDNTNIAAGKKFTAQQKQNILQANSNKNHGVVKSDLSGKILTQPMKSQAGITPRQDEWQIDHIIPKSKGGTNSYSNAQVLSRQENRLKWDQ